MSALLFLYREVIGEPLGWLDEIVRAKRPARLPVILTRDEVKVVLGCLAGTERLIRGLARALLATALAQALVGAIAIKLPNTASSVQIVILHGVFVARCLQRLPGCFDMPRRRDSPRALGRGG